MSIQKFVSRFNELEVNAAWDQGRLVLDIEGHKTAIPVSDDWKKAITSYYRARQYSFDAERLTLQANKSVEMALTPLGGFLFRPPEYVFTAGNGDKLSIGRATKKWKLAFFESDEYKKYLESWLAPRLKRKRSLFKSLDRVLYGPLTARFESKRKMERSELLEIAKHRAESCFLKLAVEKNECLELNRVKRISPIGIYNDEAVGDLVMPSATYCQPLAKFYKIAKSSLFPGQAFLSFYHVLEYQFYRISDHKLYAKVRSNLKNTEFSGSDEQIRKILAVVFKHKQNLDETALLKLVLDHYIDESDFIEFVKSLEADAGEKRYTKKREVLGDRLWITLEEGHALSNSAKVVKHIRNYLVHSSDKITRDDRYVPFTDSDETVIEYLPIMEYFARNVIYGTPAD